MIYQSLDDLTGACADISRESSKNGPTKFEVGVFCGTYITPVGDGYFEHLEQVRGGGRKLKMMESAREAVVSGLAGEKEIQMAANGVKANEQGAVVAAENGDDSEVPRMNGNSFRVSGSSRTQVEEEDRSVKDRMDISLHNFGDYNQ